MTYREFYEAACALVSGPVKVRVETWNHRHGVGPETEWMIWSAEHAAHYFGASPEEALTGCRAMVHKAVPGSGVMPTDDDPCIVREAL